MKIKKCIICNYSTFKELYATNDKMFHLPGEFQVKQCQKCRIKFLDPQPSEGELKKYYPSKEYYSYNTQEKGFFERLREYLIAHYYSPNLLSRLISVFIQNVPALPSHKKNGKILDIGCGAGDTLLLLKKLGWDVYGVDMDSHAIKNAHKRGLKNVSLGTYEYLSKYPDNFFDSIRLYHVIEHIDNPSRCLSLIQKKIKKDGELVIGTPNGASVVSGIFGSYWYNLDSPRHLFLFSPKTLKKIMADNGFKTKAVEYCSAGGVVGSIQYLLEDKMKKRIDLIHNLYLVLLFYPIDWILNKFHTGDVFVVRAKI